MLAPHGIASDLAELPPRNTPHNVDAEQALLGALMIRNDLFDAVSEVASARDFFDPLHAAIFSAIEVRVGEGRAADPITLRPSFEGQRVSDDLTVPQYLGRLVASATTIINARDYAETIRVLAVRREIIRISSDAAIAATDASIDVKPSTLIEEIESEIFQLAERGSTRSDVRFSEALSNAVAGVEEAHRSGRGFSGLSTGIRDLDFKIGGLAPGKLYIVAGRPAMGKSALATNIAWNVVRAGTPVAIYSLEMAADEIALRIASAECGVSSEVLAGGGGDGDIRKLIEVQSRIERLPLFIDDRGGISIAQLSARARRMRRRHGIGLIVVDYLQLMRAHSWGENRVQELTEITSGLKALAKDVGVPVIALSQLSRKVEERENKRPMLSDLRESGSIEQDADVVIFVYREEYYWRLKNPEPPANDLDHADWRRRFADARCENLAEAIIGKRRGGRTGTCHLYFNGPLTLFMGLQRGGEA